MNADNANLLAASLMMRAVQLDVVVDLMITSVMIVNDDVLRAVERWVLLAAM